LSADPTPAPSPSQRLVALAFRAASAILSAIPRSVSLPVARSLGPVACALLRGRRAIALENLACALPELDERERLRIARQSFGHALALAVDLLTLPRVARDPAAHCEAAPGSIELLEEARRRGRGVVLVAGHFGLMESMGIFLGSRGLPVSFVAKPFDNAALDEAVRRRRGATGNTTIHKGGAKGRARDVLEAGGLVAIVADQHVTKRDREWVPFFGLPAATTRSLALLAIETRAPIVPIHAFPLPGGRCRCEFGPVIEPPADDSRESAHALLVRVVAEMERAARRDLPAWLWIHRRWKVRPDETTQRYPAYSEPQSQEQARLARRRALQHAAAVKAE
jgi:KDO2-lipid IV(A) lauroyltransferase